MSFIDDNMDFVTPSSPLLHIPQQLVQPQRQQQATSSWRKGTIIITRKGMDPFMRVSQNITPSVVESHNAMCSGATEGSWILSMDDSRPIPTIEEIDQEMGTGHDQGPAMDDRALQQRKQVLERRYGGVHSKKPAAGRKNTVGQQQGQILAPSMQQAVPWIQQQPVTQQPTVNAQDTFAGHLVSPDVLQFSEPQFPADISGQGWDIEGLWARPVSVVYRTKCRPGPDSVFYDLTDDTAGSPVSQSSSSAAAGSGPECPIILASTTATPPPPPPQAPKIKPPPSHLQRRLTYISYQIHTTDIIEFVKNPWKKWLHSFDAYPINAHKDRYCRLYWRTDEEALANLKEMSALWSDFQSAWYYLLSHSKGIEYFQSIEDHEGERLMRDDVEETKKERLQELQLERETGEKIAEDATLRKRKRVGMRHKQNHAELSMTQKKRKQNYAELSMEQKASSESPTSSQLAGAPVVEHSEQEETRIMALIAAWDEEMEDSDKEGSPLLSEFEGVFEGDGYRMTTPREDTPHSELDYLQEASTDSSVSALLPTIPDIEEWDSTNAFILNAFLEDEGEDSTEDVEVAEDTMKDDELESSEEEE